MIIFVRNAHESKDSLSGTSGIGSSVCRDFRGKQSGVGEACRSAALTSTFID